MLVRTWNLFHGNADPPERRAFLRQMVELVTRDRPDVICLQELPVWSLRHLERWSGMHASGAVARRPLLPFGARAVTALHHGLLRSAVEGEADAILTSRPARSLGTHVVGESRLRRIAHAVEVEGVTVVNFHIDGERAQFDRVVALAPDGSIVAGDANLISPKADGFSPPLAGSIDQILVKGLTLRDGPAAWPVERRKVDGRVLSDHAPVEAVVEA
jgi:endonuclease/exonuclease/phosphatase family metal-dependent hydrolase